MGFPSPSPVRNLAEIGGWGVPHNNIRTTQPHIRTIRQPHTYHTTPHLGFGKAEGLWALLCSIIVAKQQRWLPACSHWGPARPGTAAPWYTFRAQEDQKEGYQPIHSLFLLLGFGVAGRKFNEI